MGGGTSERSEPDKSPSLQTREGFDSSKASGGATENAYYYGLESEEVKI